MNNSRKTADTCMAEVVGTSSLLFRPEMSTVVFSTKLWWSVFRKAGKISINCKVWNVFHSIYGCPSDFYL